MEIASALTSLGLDDKESLVYLSALELGEDTLAHIAKKAGVNRATAYYVVNGLVEKGLLAHSIQKGHKRIVASTPEKLYDVLAQKQTLLKSVLPQLKALENSLVVKPKIQFFEGESGLVSLFLDNLSAKDGIMSIAGQHVFQDVVLKHIPNYIEQRKEKKIFLKMIVPDNATMQHWKSLDRDQLRQTLLISEVQFPFFVHIDIYNNKVAISSFKDNMGLLIESRDIAHTLRSVFGFMWQSLGGK